MSRRARFSESDSRLLRGGVDRNGGAGKTVQLKGGSPPARRRGSKHPCPRAPAFFDPSPPARRRGSNLFVAAIETRQTNWKKVVSGKRWSVRITHGGCRLI